MFTDVCHWAEALLDWAEERGLRSEYYTPTYVDVTLPGGHLYINATGPSTWKVRTFPDGPLSRSHIVVDEGDDFSVRVRRGPTGALKIVQYRPGAGNAEKLADSARDIAMLMSGPLRRDFLARFGGGDAL